MLAPLVIWHAPHGGIGTQPMSWAALAYIGLIAGPFGTWCVMQATATLPTVVSSVGFLSTPAISLILANLMLGEAITADLLAGSGTDNLRHRVRRMAGAAMILHAVEEGLGSPPLVLLHGLFGSAAEFRRGAASVCAASPNDSPRPAQSWGEPAWADMRYETMAADVMQTLERLHALPAVLLGPLDGRQGRDAGRVDAAGRGRPTDRRRHRAGGISAALSRQSPRQWRRCRSLPQYDARRRPVRRWRSRCRMQGCGRSCCRTCTWERRLRGV